MYAIFILLAASAPNGVFAICRFNTDKVAEGTVTHSTIVTEWPNDTFSLDLTIDWERPPHDHDGYEVKLVSKFTDETKINSDCNAEGYSRTYESTFTFEDILFGYEYAVWILLYNSTLNQSSWYPSNVEIKTPDCYTTTNSLSFCASQPIGFTSPARDLRTECIEANFHGNLTDIELSWLPPIQVNGTISEYTIGVRPNERVSFEQVKHYKPRNKGDEPRNLTERYFQEFHGLLTNVTYVVQIRPLVIRANESTKWQGEETEESFRSAIVLEHDGNTSHLAPVCLPFTPTTVVASLPDSSTSDAANLSLWAVLGTMTGMVGTMILAIVMLLLIVRKKSSVNGRNTEFVRYPDGISIIGNSIIKKTSSGIHPITKCVDPVFASKELDRTHLEVGEELGKGSFGVVYKGLVYGLDGNQKYKPVAVKSLKVGANEIMKLEFLDEIRLILEIGSHPNILPLLGCCTVDEPYYLVTELLKYGDLLHYLMKCRDVEFQDEIRLILGIASHPNILPLLGCYTVDEPYHLVTELLNYGNLLHDLMKCRYPGNAIIDPLYDLTPTMQLQIAAQLSRGMEYISSTRYYHGDLAARNVLVGDNLVVKISDFGLADDIYQRGYKRLAPSKKRPVKWVSLETNLEGRCSIESDVWSFGIVLYEIYTLGGTPYENMEAQAVINKLKEGYRLQKPEDCPDDMYTLMLHCWQERPSSRPSFTDIYNTLDSILSESSDYLTNLDPPEKPWNEGGVVNPSCYTDETDIESLRSVDRYSSLLISTSGMKMEDMVSEEEGGYDEDGAVTYKIERFARPEDDLKHGPMVPTIIVNSSTPDERTTAFVNESYQSHPV